MMKRGRTCYFIIDIYISYILLLFSSSFSPLSFPSSCVHTCSAEDVPQGRKGEKMGEKEDWML